MLSVPSDNEIAYVLQSGIGPVVKSRGFHNLGNVLNAPHEVLFMPEISIRPLGPSSELHNILENYPPVGESQNISLYDRAWEIKEAAKDFLD